jgi:glycine/sarcosine/betaine reductase complex component C subunit beta
MGSSSPSFLKKMEVDQLSFPVIKGTGYVLVHTPDIMHHHGTTQSQERAQIPDSDYLKH